MDFTILGLTLQFEGLVVGAMLGIGAMILIKQFKGKKKTDPSKFPEFRKMLIDGHKGLVRANSSFKKISKELDSLE